MSPLPPQVPIPAPAPWNQRNRTLLYWLAGAGLVIVLISIREQRDRPPDPRAFQEAETRARQEVTLAKFSRIQPGMMWTAVEEVMGSPGEVQSQTNIDGTLWTTRVWRDRRGGTIVVTYRHYIVDRVSQMGLTR